MIIYDESKNSAADYECALRVGSRLELCAARVGSNSRHLSWTHFEISDILRKRMRPRPARFPRIVPKLYAKWRLPVIWC